MRGEKIPPADGDQRDGARLESFAGGSLTNFSIPPPQQAICLAAISAAAMRQAQDEADEI